MRTNRRSKREMAITAAILDIAVAQVLCEAGHKCLDEGQAASLEFHARGISKVAEQLFVQASDKPRPIARY